MPGKRLVRPIATKKIAGVCVGLADYFDVDPTFIRLGFALSFVFTFGSPVLVYLILWAVMAEAPQPRDEGWS
ncbi:MAG TPA: PspC family transcriptional regulator [Myxococcales bacterium]|nr:PspC family transcriptional regulator [Myxococcales bacterium]HAN30160.1 PspC family transcriptional regulator [Myxococcales bacterium]